MRYWKIIISSIFLLAVLIVIIIAGANKIVQNSSASKIYSSINDIPHNKVGLLLGTSKTLRNGRINLYYKYRIEAAVSIFRSGKIEYILISGDNSTKEYDEPTDIKLDLIAQGIPEDKIFLDYAGFRTLDSILRCKYIFGQDTITIISQQFHNERAVYIAECSGINAVAFNAKDVSVRYGMKTRLREKFARVKVILDITFGKNPKFWGEKIVIQ